MENLSYAFIYLILKPIKINSKPGILWVIIKIYEENFQWYAFVLPANHVVFCDMPTCPKLEHLQESPFLLCSRLCDQKWNSWDLEKVSGRRSYPLNISMCRAGSCGMQTLVNSISSSLFHAPLSTRPPGYQTSWCSDLKPINK